MKAFSRVKTTHHHWMLFEKIAFDYKGPFAKLSYSKYRGFFLFSDYFSSYVWAYFVKEKSEVHDALVMFFRQHVKNSQHRIKTLQADYENIVISGKMENWLIDRHIKLSLSSPYRHDQNGQIERDVQNVMDKARTLMASYDVPSKYWEFAVDTAVYLINRSPTSSNGYKTPYELVYGVKPDISNLVPFYCPGVYHLTQDERKDPMQPKAALCRMLGYDDRSHCYKLLNVETQKIVMRTDAKFDSKLVEAVSKSKVDGVDVYQELDDHDDLTDLKGAVSSRTRSGMIGSSSYSDADLTNLLDMDPDKGYAVDHWDYIESTEESMNLFSYQNGKNIEAGERSTHYSPHMDEATVSPYYSDFVLNPKDNVISAVSDDLVKDSVKMNVPNLTLPQAPSSVEEALTEDNPDRLLWWDAIYKEMQVLNDYETFGEAEEDGHAMKTKLVLTLTFANDYTRKYKARLVVCGYTQIKGLDYQETFSPTTSTLIVFILLHIGAHHGYTMCNFDVSSAFLEGMNDYVQYCRLPKWLGTDSKGRGKRVQILRSLYGEKQAPKIWSDRLNEIFMDMNLQRCPVEACLYKYRDEENNFLYICVHVDDGLMVASSQTVIDDFMQEFQTHIKKATLFPTLKKYLGIDIVEDKLNNKVHLSQAGHIAKIDVPMLKKEVRVPMQHTVDLRGAMPDEKNDSLLPAIGHYRYVVDRTRPDLLAAVGELSHGGGTHPSAEHLKVCQQVRTYMEQTKDMTLTLGGKSPIELFGFSDASHIMGYDSKGRLGCCCFLGLDSGAIQSLSQLDTTVSHSSMIVEIKALDILIRIIIHIRNVLEFLDHLQSKPTPCYHDNKSAVALSTTLKTNHRTRHINLRINFIREQINAQVIQVIWVSTGINVSDILTKALAYEPFTAHQNNLLNGFGGYFDPTIIVDYNNKKRSNEQVMGGKEGTPNSNIDGVNQDHTFKHQKSDN
jgi:hypothetical protein